ncbi:uncharacterized protein LOC111274134 [Durio zibethinus]|uniref:Uncharacterized protein LOC111274134 n=1 Tax=Durio zibethinus TaxID=66656 RepID=A0A6P5WF71_DURZI|nr:uncharacterized protein LOC111274134 [Durio zibethinus]
MEDRIFWAPPKTNLSMEKMSGPRPKGIHLIIPKEFKALMTQLAVLIITYSSRPKGTLKKLTITCSIISGSTYCKYHHYKSNMISLINPEILVYFWKKFHHLGIIGFDFESMLLCISILLHVPVGFTVLPEQDPKNHKFYFFLMELSNWCSSGTQELRWSQGYAKSRYDRMLSVNGLVIRSKLPSWRMLWRKLMREKKKIFDCSSSTRVHVSYDPYTYAQNFDQGLMSTDPDDLSRSFSARFAVPSRVFE